MNSLETILHSLHLRLKHLESLAVTGEEGDQRRANRVRQHKELKEVQDELVNEIVSSIRGSQDRTWNLSSLSRYIEHRRQHIILCLSGMWKKLSDRVDSAKHTESAERRRYYRSLIAEAFRRDGFIFNEAGAQESYDENSTLTFPPTIAVPPY